jgi:GNAT superfamily N-acetyltransferase
VLRLARPGEADAVAALAETTGGPLGDPMRKAIEDGTASNALLTAARTGNHKALIEPVTQAAMTGDPAILSEVSLALVAEREGRVVGELNAIAPTAFIGQLIEGGMDPVRASICALAVTKIKSLAVEPDSRGLGIASALLDASTRVFDEAGFLVQYGSFANGSGLETFYAARDFNILPPGKGISLWVVFGSNVMLAADPTEQMFARSRAGAGPQG